MSNKYRAFLQTLQQGTKRLKDRYVGGLTLSDLRKGRKALKEYKNSRAIAKGDLKKIRGEMSFNRPSFRLKAHRDTLLQKMRLSSPKYKRVEITNKKPKVEFTQKTRARLKQEREKAQNQLTDGVANTLGAYGATTLGTGLAVRPLLKKKQKTAAELIQEWVG